jgi:plasmid stabilization system protein ParE
MGLRISLHRRAAQDLQDIQSYLVQQAGAQAAERVRLHLLGKIRRLGNTPRMGRPTSNAAIRILPPTRYPYRIYYAVARDVVIVLHIRHSARRDPDSTSF